MRTTPQNRDRGTAPNNRASATVEIVTYLTPEDRAAIEAAAKRESLSVSSYVRRVALIAARRAGA